MAVIIMHLSYVIVLGYHSFGLLPCSLSYKPSGNGLSEVLSLLRSII